MKLLYILLISSCTFAVQFSAYAQGSMLRITCDGNDVGAEVSVNGAFKGECPLDVTVDAGTLRLRLVKKVGTTRERLFEQEIRMGDGVAKKVEAHLGPAILTPEGRSIEAERERQATQKRQQEQEAARLREEDRQREMALAERTRQEQVMISLADFKTQGIEPGNGKSFRDCPQCPEMVLIPPGKPLQRTPPASALIGWLNRVSIAYPLAVGKFELTFDEWDACVAEDTCREKPDGVAPGLFSNTRWGRGRQPVIFVSREDAEVYLGWLSHKSGQSYRLLSTAEFTYAARSGRSTALPWGNELGSNNANCKNCGSSTAGEQPVPVGSFKPNDWGIYDMIGNVSEMVADCSVLTSKLGVVRIDGGPARTEECAVTEPATTRAILGDAFVVMGGGYNGDLGPGINIASYYAKQSSSAVGMRVARTLDVKTPDNAKVK